MFFFFLPGNPNEVVPQQSSDVPVTTLKRFGLDVFADYNRIGSNLVIQRLGQSDIGPGVFVAPRPTDGTDPIYTTMKTDIVWQRYAPKNHFLGYVPSSIPRPAAFQKKPTYSRYFIEDENGGEWLVPCIQSPDPEHQVLPANLVRDFDTGQVVQRVKKKYQSLWDLSGEIADRLKNNTIDEDLEWSYEAAMEVLRCNYYITDSMPGLLEQLGCGILDHERCAHILFMSCDWPLRAEYLMLEQEKKTNQAPGSSSALPGHQEAIESPDLQEVS